MVKATKNSFHCLDLPESIESIHIDKSFTKSEFDSITTGMIPLSNDDKWFIYFEEPYLYVHRSATGYCMFKVGFQANSEEPELVDITEVIINQDNKQTYNGTYNNIQILLLLLKALLNQTVTIQEIKNAIGI